MTEIKIGAHLSIAGGYTNALLKAQEIGCNSLQIFSSSPRLWVSPPISDEQIQLFLKTKEKLQIDPIYFHASYLVNLADDGEIGKKSVQSILYDLSLAEKLGIRGVIIHLGSFKGESGDVAYDVLISNIKKILSQSPKNSLFIIENAGSHKVGATIDEIGRIIKDVNDPRVCVCLDTCHMWAAGYDISTQEKYDTFFDIFEKTIGLTKLEVFQVNDSKDQLGSFRDRHENIGKGTIEMSTFQLLIQGSKTAHIPFILEVPGKEKSGPDKENVEILKSLRLKKETS